MGADKEEIRARNDIVEVIGRVVTLRKRGRNWQGLCPFHQEKTASFNVDPVTQTFKCFGCGASGDVFGFIERYENMSFVEAAEFLARRVGLAFERRGGARTQEGVSERERLFRINAEAVQFFQTHLANTPAAREYAAHRGLTEETLRRFQIGYAPDRWDALAGYFEVHEQDLRAATTAGVVSAGRDGGYYDLFRGRLMFPIHDEQERVVGFGGRAMGDEQPKYLNTGETPIFTKSRLLYGLPFARRKIGEDGRTLLMEGYMDVIAAHQAGFTNAVATLGTSLTEDHARKLARLVPGNPVAVLVYDGDSAGVRATLRASEMLEKEGVEVRVVVLPEGDDPDSMVLSGRADAFGALVEGAVGRVTYQLDRVIGAADQSSEAGRAKLLRQIVAILASVPTRSERDVYVDRVWRYHPLSASEPGSAKEQLHRDAEAYAASQKAKRESPRNAAPGAGAAGGATPGAKASASKPGERPRRTAAERAERELMRALLDPDWFAHVLQHASEEVFLSPQAAQLFRLVRDNREALATGSADVLSAIDSSGDAEFADSMRMLMQEFRAGMANAPLSVEVVMDCLGRLRRSRIARLKDDMARMMQRTLTDDDRENVRKHQELLSQLLADTTD